VLELNAKLRTVMANVEVRYFDYRDEPPPQELDEIIEKRDLELPVVFVNGKPKFQGGLPSVEDLLAAIGAETR